MKTRIFLGIFLGILLLACLASCDNIKAMYNYNVRYWEIEQEKLEIEHLKTLKGRKAWLELNMKITRLDSVMNSRYK
jgi:hypothetical protein